MSLEKSKLSGRQAEIMRWFRIRDKPATDREVMYGLGYSSLQSVKEEIKYLLQVKELRKVCDTKCPIYFKKVRVVDIPRETVQPQNKLL